jgi:acyl-CoA synthetase (AMP-forming)/AMP-acid ligase II
MKGAECEGAIETALGMGYRHIDTAEMYGNEVEVGRALAANVVPRGDVFLTSKGWWDKPDGPALRAACEASLERLKTPYLDLYLIHWPSPQLNLASALAGLARIKADGVAPGDVGYFDEDGFLYLCDRIKDMIITGGENVYPAEVEDVMCRHPAVQCCAVIGVPHEKWGEAVHAIVVLRPQALVTAAELDAHCRQHIGAYKCPKSVEFRDALPMTAAGKVQKTALRQSLAK